MKRLKYQIGNHSLNQQLHNWRMTEHHDRVHFIFFIRYGRRLATNNDKSSI
ncbi:MAG: hypothetical protein ABF586_08050 [Sporolactobacillus sp.]